MELKYNLINKDVLEGLKELPLEDALQKKNNSLFL